MKILRFLRGVAAVVAGMFAAGWILIGGRYLAFGDGLAQSPEDAGPGSQLIVALTWTAAGAVASWTAAWILRGRVASLITSAWLFQTACLSPGVRPAEMSMRVVCALGAGVAGFATMALQQHRASMRDSSPAPFVQ